MIGVDLSGWFGSWTTAAGDCVVGKLWVLRWTPFGHIATKPPESVPTYAVPSPFQMFGDAAANPGRAPLFFSSPLALYCAKMALLGTKRVPSAPRSGEPVTAPTSMISSTRSAG